MVALDLNNHPLAPFRILCMGAHSDDIEIGCGGALLQLLDNDRNIEVRWIVFSSGSDRRREAERSAALFLEGARWRTVGIHDFRDGFFPYDGTGIKECFERLKNECCPDVIFTHYGRDRHQDHRIISDLTWNTFRDHLILEYEIPKYDGDLGSPNCYVQLDEAVSRRKIDYIMKCFASQRPKPWFTRDTFVALQRLRGVESRAPHGFAEGFYCRKLILGTGAGLTVQALRTDSTERQGITVGTSRMN